MASWAWSPACSDSASTSAAGPSASTPKFDLEEFSCFWSHGRGWGIYLQQRHHDGTLRAVVEVLHGTLAADHVDAPVPVTIAER
jgi:hypothetical protein